jgi:CheY-like chemotaxis protein
VIPATFLLVDDVAENRYFVGKTLLRKYPGARLFECITSAAALDALKIEAPRAVIVHRAADTDGVTLIRLLRKVSGSTPIIMLSRREQCGAGIAAGANAFLNHDAWLRIGTIVEEVLAPNYVKALTSSPFKSVDFLRRRKE